MEEIAQEIHLLFVKYGYKWTLDTGMYTPSVEDIQKVLGHAKEVLDNAEGDDVQLEVGRLLMKKRDNTLDVYVYFGEIND